MGLVPHERVQQRPAEKIEDLPQHLEETVEIVRLVTHERVQQRPAEKIEDLPQHLEETVEIVRLVPHERVQQRPAEKIEDAPQSPPLSATQETFLAIPRPMFDSSLTLYHSGVESQCREV